MGNAQASLDQIVTSPTQKFNIFFWCTIKSNATRSNLVQQVTKHSSFPNDECYEDCLVFSSSIILNGIITIHWHLMVQEVTHFENMFISLAWWLGHICLQRDVCQVWPCVHYVSKLSLYHLLHIIEPQAWQELTSITWNICLHLSCVKFQDGHWRWMIGDSRHHLHLSLGKLSLKEAEAHDELLH